MEGLRLATLGRFISLAVIGLLLLVLMPFPAVLYIEGLLVLFAVAGALHYLARRRVSHPIAPYLFILLDFVLLTIAVLGPNPLATEPLPAPFSLRNGGVVYFFVIVSSVAFGYSPRLMVWAGCAAALCWAAGTAWVVTASDAFTEYSAEAARVPDLALNLDPRFVDLGVAIQDMCVMLIVAGLLAGVVARSRRLVATQVETARQRANLSRYLPPNMVDELAGTDDPFGAVRSQRVAVMFVDIVGFTAISEALRPEEVILLLRRFHGLIEQTVFEHGGTLDKFLGDGAMATFGSPRVGARDAVDALACARSLVERQWESGGAGGAALRIAIGLHYGDVVLGDIGSERRLEFAVLGDTVNVASRLQQLTRTSGGEIAASAELIGAARLQDPSEAERLLRGFAAPRQQLLPGRAAPVAVCLYDAAIPGPLDRDRGFREKERQ